MRNKKVFAAIIIAVIALGTSYLIFVLSRPLESGPNSIGRITVTTSFYPLYFFVSEIGRDKVNVANITPTGAEPHDFEPTSQDLVRIENSRLLVIDGVLEPWAGKIKKDLAGKTTTILEVGDGLFSKTVADENGNHDVDPHIWLSPIVAQKMVEKITGSLVSVDFRNAIYYRENANNLISRLSNLDTEYRKGLAECSNHDIITSHAAFSYLAKEYNLNQVAIAGLSPDLEPSLKQLTEIVGFAKAKNLKYIFFESLVSPKLSQTLAQEVGAKSLVLNPLEGLAAEDIKAGSNYFTVMESNLANLRIALSCQ